MRGVGLFGALFLTFLTTGTDAFKANDFKTCDKSGFCRRGRALSARAKEAGTAWKSPYSVLPDSVEVSSNQASAKAAVKSELYPDINFELELRVQEDGVVRVLMDEKDGLKKRYNEAAAWALVEEPKVSQDITWTTGKNDLKATYGDLSIVVTYQPLTVTMLRNGKEEIVLNGRGLLHMEHFREKTPAVQLDEGEEAQTVVAAENPRAWFEGIEEDALWEEKFNSWTDTKPKGPESLSIDIAFPNHDTVYGIPQHATNLSLPTTTGEDPGFTDPFRLHNADVFEYLSSSPVSLYGSIPLLQAHSVDSTVAVFDVVASETWIDIDHPTAESTSTHWISESGILDIFLIPGPTPADIFARYTRLTGTASMPPQWSLGYHQCRWNYVSSDDVRSVQRRFDEEDMPVDVFWLDIEYAEEHKYFIWDEKVFPDPVEMTNDVAAAGRHMVVIIDPHLKRAQNYPVYKEASEKELLVKQKDGKEYEGWCWTGSSSWVDMFNPAAFNWWKGLFKFSSEDGGFAWTKSTEAVHIWNDMNEPAIFNGPEVSMPKDMIHHGGWEHRDIHNLNGVLFHNATYEAVKERTTPFKRPFVLTRSFYAGSQRFGAMWTGDNLGTWEHMAVGLKMVLSNGIAGMTFAGSDVGGFFGNPEPEMLVRWYQLGAFNPFFRAHAHIDTKRREPYLLDEPYKTMLKDILRLRYTLLPVWYTAFYEAHRTGMPILRPHYVVFPKDKAGFAIDDQFFLGSSLLIKPVTEKGVQATTVYLPEDQVYYDYFSYAPFYGSAEGKTVDYPVELDTFPVFMRGGSVIPTRERPRRSAPLMAYDPFTLTVALAKDQFSATGELYLDNGEDYDYEAGEYVWRSFTAKQHGWNKGVMLTSKALGRTKRGGAYERSLRDAGVRVEKIVFVGLDTKPVSVKIVGKRDLVWEFHAGQGKGEGVLTVKDPKALIVDDWSIIV
ncbi:glycoside hydrolase family 31 protein, partial [Cylindrobasidium torrendii FP15055 ss-10]